jgi:cytoskeleton protein RodZ
MTESMADDGRSRESAADPAHDGSLTAGAILRAARVRQGVHIAMLAAAIKVSPRKLDALENDRYDELPDATFTRALAQTVCRALKIDAAPVLAKLPEGAMRALEQVSAGLNTPFRERPGRVEIGNSVPPMPLVWGGVALLAAAALVAFWPADGPRLSLDMFSSAAPEAATTTVKLPPAAGAASTPLAAVEVATAGTAAASAGSAASAASVPAGAIETVHSAPPIDLAQDPVKGVSLVTTEASWIEIVDANGQSLLSRVVTPGETVNVDGALPLKVKVGNARGTQLVFKGQVLDLERFTRDNVARVELK